MKASFQKIADYGLIGNGRSAALVGKNGSVDWLCWPRFDSPSLFGGLLDGIKGGYWQICPASSYVAQHDYLNESNVLQTRFETSDGVLLLTDWMVGISEEEKAMALHPDHELIRRLECVQGEVRVQIYFCPRPDYGQQKAQIQNRGKLGLFLNQFFALHSPLALQLDGEKAWGTVTLKAGEKLNFSLTYSEEAPAVVPSLDESLVNNKLERTITWWKMWAAQAQYQGPYRATVIRSALILKLLGYAPSGAFVAAPTTSLPERVGGNLNWDYRFCWLRDASLTVRTLQGLGYQAEANAFVSWMLHSTRLTLPKLNVTFDVYGEATSDEIELPHLAGYAYSHPVRIGCATQYQLQLDVYGEVLDGAEQYVLLGNKLDKETAHVIRTLGQFVCDNWREKDSGIWEERGDVDHYTFSKLLCWVTLDKILKMSEQCGLSTRQKNLFEENRRSIRKEIEEKAWSESLQSYTAKLNGNYLDACLFLMPYFGFEEARSERMQATAKAMNSRLSAGPGLIYRYEKSFNQEGAFLLCTLWKIDFLLRGGGTKEEAKSLFETFLGYASHLGLFAEEVDVGTREQIGNFPQAFTHLGIINVALLMEER